MKKREGERKKKKKQECWKERGSWKQLEIAPLQNSYSVFLCHGSRPLKKKRNMPLMKALSLRRQEKVVLELAAQLRPISCVENL